MLSDADIPDLTEAQYLILCQLHDGKRISATLEDLFHLEDIGLINEYYDGKTGYLLNEAGRRVVQWSRNPQ